MTAHAKCMACGVEKDRRVPEPFPKNEYLDCYSGRPAWPLIDIGCQGEDMKEATVCHACLIKLAPDMWIGRHCWESLNPLTSYKDLPLFTEELYHNGYHWPFCI